MDTDEYVIRVGGDGNELRDANATGDGRIPATSGGVDGAA